MKTSKLDNLWQFDEPNPQQRRSDKLAQQEKYISTIIYAIVHNGAILHRNKRKN